MGAVFAATVQAQSGDRMKSEGVTDISGPYTDFDGPGELDAVRMTSMPASRVDPDHELLEEPFWPLLAARIPAMEDLRLHRLLAAWRVSVR